jgi:hypothetical protein
MTIPSGAPFDPRAGRQRFLKRFLEISLAIVFVLACAGLFLPEDAGKVAAGAMVAALIGVPAVRIGWLVIRWSRLGDRPFALAGVVLLAVMASGIILSR